MVSDLSSWTLLISQQQEETARAQREEDAELERDIARARQLRASRQSGFISPAMAQRSTFNAPTLASFSSSSARSAVSSAAELEPVNKPLASTSAARPSSLANMLGSSQTGPKLTRTPQAIGSDAESAPPSNGGMGLPGMGGGPARGDTPASGPGVARRWTPATTATPSTLEKPSIKPVGHTNQSGNESFAPEPSSSSPALPFDRRAPASLVATQPSSSRPVAPSNTRSTTLPAPNSTATAQSSHPTAPLEHRTKPSLTTQTSYSSPAIASTPSLLRPIPKPDPNPPGISPPPAPPSEAFQRPSAGRAPTASLTRLKGRGIVEAQLRKSKLRGETDDQGDMHEFGSPSMGSGGWDASGSGRKPSRSVGGSGGFPRSVAPERSQTHAVPLPSTGTQPFLPASTTAPSGRDAFPVLRPTRQHRPSASISQLPTQPPPPASATTSRHRPTASVGRLPTIGALTTEASSSIDRHLPPRIRTAGRMFEAKQTEDSLSSVAPKMTALAGSPRVSVKSFVRSVESPVAAEGGPGRRMFGGQQPVRSKTAPFPAPPTAAPISHATAKSPISSSIPPAAVTAATSPVASLVNPYSSFYTPAPAPAPTPRPASPVKPAATFRPNVGIGLPGLATPSELATPKEQRRTELQTVASDDKGARDLVLPESTTSGKTERKGPPSPIKSRMELFSQPDQSEARSSSPTKPAFSGLPPSPTKGAFSLGRPQASEQTEPSPQTLTSAPDRRPPSPIKTGRTSPFIFTPSSPTKATTVVPDSPSKSAAALALSSATPVRVRRGKSGSGADLNLPPVETAEEKTRAAPAGSPPGALSHPTRDRARKPKSKNRPSLASPSASSTSLVQTVKPTSPTKEVSLPLSPVKASVAPAVSVTTPTKKAVSPVTPTFQNLAQRRSVWGDQAPIGVRPLSSHSKAENLVEKEVVPAKGPKGTFGGKALPGMVASEEKTEPAVVVSKAVRKETPATIVMEKPKMAKEFIASKPASRTTLAPLPTFSVHSILASGPKSTLASAIPPLTLSLEILSIVPSGQTAALPAATAGVPFIFYETELLAIVHRSKSRETGLVSSMVWGWQGRGWTDERGRGVAKLKDVAGRLSAVVVGANQGEEGGELMVVLGGKLVVRQGPREHFSSENTSLYTVQESHGSLFIDEVDLLPTSLASRHSLVLTVLSQVFLYHGRGSLRSERIVGRQYAALLAKDSPAPFIELEEADGEKGEDSELFWMCFGESDGDEAGGARADHWKWRGKTGGADELRGWRVDAAAGEGKEISPLPSTTAQSIFAPSTGVKVILLAFEIFVVVPLDARSQTRDIEPALKVAESISSHLAPSKPFLPPVHTIVMPSRIPVDLRTYFRCLDEDAINGGRAPELMNVLSLAETRDRLASPAGLEGTGWVVNV